MEDSDGFLNKITKHQRTRILPLRWIGNLCSLVSSRSLLIAFELQEQDNYGARYKFHCKVWKYVDKPYRLWGTYYSMDTDK